MSIIPDTLVATRNSVDPTVYIPPTLAIRTESGSIEIRLSRLVPLETQLSQQKLKTYPPSENIPFSSLPRFTMLVGGSFSLFRVFFTRQSHLIFSFTEHLSHRPVTLHFLLCSTSFVNGESIVPHFADTQSFANIKGIPPLLNFFFSFTNCLLPPLPPKCACPVPLPSIETHTCLWLLLLMSRNPASSRLHDDRHSWSQCQLLV